MPEPTDAPAGLLHSLRKTFLTGLVLCLPVALTVYVVNFLLDLLASPARDFLILPVLRAFLQRDRATELLDTPGAHIAITLVSALLVVGVILAIGVVSRHIFGRVLLDAMEDAVNRVPMINKVYDAAKQMVDTFGAKNRDTFKEVVIVEYPRAGCMSVGFVSNRTPASRWGGPDDGTKWAHVFVPTAPNPTAGFVLLLPEHELKPAGMTVSEGMRFVVSCGASIPVTPPAPPASN